MVKYIFNDKVSNYDSKCMVKYIFKDNFLRSGQTL